MSPPTYPRVAHLIPGRGTRDDTTLGPADLAALLATEVTVEEKLDGANVAVWLDRDRCTVAAALRSGEGGLDRAGQLGPLRAWVAAHDAELRSLLAHWDAVYGEWLLLTHTVAYDAMPAYLVVLDLWRPAGFATAAERDAFCARAGLATPPTLWRGTLRSVDAVEALIGRSAWAGVQAEGVVVRPVDAGAPRLAKLVRRGFEPTDDETWRRPRPRNELLEGEVSWH